MTKEEIIATAIHEAFICGKEVGEESQRMYAKMQNEIDYAAKQVNPDELRKKIEDTEAALSALYAEYMGSKEHELHLSEENKTLLASNEEKDATITELKSVIAELKSVIAGLKSQLANKDAIIKDKLQEQEPLSATVPDDSPSGKEEPSPSINFSEGDEVIIKGEFFEDSEHDYPAIIKEVMDTVATVELTAKDLEYYRQPFIVPFEYLTKI